MVKTQTEAAPKASSSISAPFSGKEILCLATQEWDAHWTPVQQVTLRLAPQNKVIYFEPFHPPFAWLKQSNALLKRQREERIPRLREVRPNLFVYRPAYPYLPFNMQSAVSLQLNGQLLKAEIRSLLKKLGFTRPWLWAHFAQSLSVLDLDFEHFIYDCADDFPAFFPNPTKRAFVARIDEALYRRANLVFVGSEPIYQKKAHLNPKTFIVNHAADVAHFSKAADPEVLVPEDLERIPHPRIGFVGMVDAVRFDAELIGQIAENPQLQIIIVGGFVNGADATKTLPSRPNIHILGMKPVIELPSYLKGLDVCLMPYRLNEATRHIYPLKLHEYLATGKPIVSTAIPAVEDFRDLIYVAQSRAEFVDLVDHARGEKDPSRAARRQNYARQHTWEAHVEKKTKLINEHLLAR